MTHNLKKSDWPENLNLMIYKLVVIRFDLRSIVLWNDFSWIPDAAEYIQL